MENPIFTSGFLSSNATKKIHGDCTELTELCKHFSVFLHNSFSWEAVCCIHHPHRKHEQGQLFLGSLLYRFSGKVVQDPFICFSSLADQTKYSETPKYSEQYFRHQESGTKVSICKFSVFEV